MKIVDVRVTPVSVLVRAPLRYSTGADAAIHRLIVEIDTDDVAVSETLNASTNRSGDSVATPGAPVRLCRSCRSRDLSRRSGSRLCHKQGQGSEESHILLLVIAFGLSVRYVHEAY